MLVLATGGGKSFAAVCDSGQATQEDLNRCAWEDYQKADEEMKAVLKQLMDKVSPKGRSKLRSVQKKWVAYRDDQSAFNAMGSVGGTVHPMAVYEWMTDLTKRQTEVLRMQLTCEEGVVVCGRQ